MCHIAKLSRIHDIIQRNIYQHTTFFFTNKCYTAWRENTNKMQQFRCLLSTSDVYYQLLSQHVSGIIIPIIRRTKTVYYCIWCLRWKCYMWLVAVVGRCVVGCEHCESKSNLHSARTLLHNAPQLQPATSSTNTICSNTRSLFSWWWA